MKNLLLILAVFVPFISFAGDHNATSDTYRNGAYISIDPSVRIYNEDRTWTNNPSKTFGYLSTVTSDIQAQINAKATITNIIGLDAGVTNAAGLTIDQRATNAATTLTGNFGNRVAVNMTNAANAITGTFTGLNTGLTNASGNSPLDKTATNNFGNSAAITMTNALNSFTGIYTNSTYYGNGVGLTNSSVTYLTNFTFNALQTNLTTLSQTWRVPVIVSEPAGTIGSADSQAQVCPPSGSYVMVDNVAIQGGSTSILQTNKGTLVFEVPLGWGYRVTNISTGTGYLATNNPAATNEVTFHP